MKSSTFTLIFVFVAAFAVLLSAKYDTKPAEDVYIAAPTSPVKMRPVYQGPKWSAIHHDFDGSVTYSYNKREPF
jgi:hypothetical protein